MAQQSWPQELQKIPFNPLLSLVFLIPFLYVFKRITSSKTNLPPSPPKIPIIGNLHQLGKLPHRSLQALSNKGEEVEALTNKIRDTCLTGGSVNLSEMFIATTNNIASRCILGQKFEEESGKSKFGELSRRVMVLFVAFCFGDFFPSLGWIDVLTGIIPSLKSTVGGLDAIFDQVIGEHEIEKIDDDQPNRLDFVHILLRLQKNSMLDFELTKDNLKAILMLPGDNVQGEDLDMTEVNGLTVTKKNPLHLVPILHSP
ncbi:hypothetical protein FH972_019237 [Carpinus fangiana]|uniref:Cytochrome P450 n=1 Tax=Carpinus fangiana TaxID=176857 RepID=A0A5N6RRR3_9ROSI|nr:hypothetical protein FH972_019237 [Carpinus fangiana]